ncbi:hypothetical protein OG369_15030 [Streptomyces sp. NBC_01221]|uniref:hypothetical protein n=1 Tax=Streptomyces sp. NBC_01221 TaxID=2903782 RepID=UPI00225B0282|nr:hypothetical protein [Streptomyces sp. NBC_01221]MCX4787449.1 hypothetical protein [Streptomyces sp. NBC_01221]
MRARLALPLALPAVAVLLVGGCDSAPSAPRTSTAPGAARGSAESGGPPSGPQNRSLWTLIDDRGKAVTALADDDPDVTAIRKTVVLHSGAVDNRDADSAETGVKAEFSFYSAEFERALDSQHYGTRVAALFHDNALATHQVKIAWYRSTVYRDRRTAKAEMDSVTEFTAGDSAYLKKHGLTLSTPYTQHRTLDLIKRDGTWVITGIRKTPLQRPAPKPVPRS